MVFIYLFSIKYKYIFFTLSTISFNTNWKICAKWLIDCESLPKFLSEKLYRNQLTFDEFACSLRDGVILCSLLDYLRPGSINLSLVNRQTNLGETLSLENIQLFLDTCVNQFNMNETDLFPPDVLFDLNMESVFSTLSILSKTDAAAERCNGGLHLISGDDESENASDLYFQLANNYIDTNNYISCDFYFNDSNDIYDKIMNVSDEMDHRKPRDADFVIREIMLTEDRHIKIMEEYQKHFINQLSTLLEPEDQRLIAMDFGILIEFHRLFLSKLKETSQVNDSRTNSICDVFNDYKRRFMTTYRSYILNLPHAVNKFNNLINENVRFKRKIDECMRNSTNSSIKLTDYLTIPFQRVSKYHLLLENLYKKYNGDETKKERIKEVWISFKEVGYYLNETSKDQESIIYIEKVMKNLNVELPFGKTFKEFGRLIKEDKIRIKLKNNINEVARTRTVFLFQTSIIILMKNLFGKFRHFASISIYEITINDPNDKNKKNSLNMNNKQKPDELCLEITDTHISYTYQLYFKDIHQKQIWIDKLKEAKPIDSNLTTNNHKFRLSNFDTDIVECDSCKQNINGIFFQGYKCIHCFQRVHNKYLCLTKVGKCRDDSRSNINLTEIRRESNKTKKDVINKLSYSSSNTSSLTFSTNSTNLSPQMSVITTNDIEIVSGDLIKDMNSGDYINSDINDVQNTLNNNFEINNCKAIYTYNGKPKGPFDNLLYFEPGDIIQIIDSDDDVWWKGCRIDFKCELSSYERIYRSIGYFPRSYVKLITSHDYSRELKNFSWYLIAEKDHAEWILRRIVSNDTMFMVRFNSTKSSYAISFKYKTIIKHIKIEERLFNRNNMNQIEFIRNEAETFYYYQRNDAANNSAVNDLSFSHTKFYSIANSKHFLSIKDLVIYYSTNTLNSNENEFPGYNITLGRAYR
jgi:guanine nucleotide exchange factor VAV